MRADDYKPDHGGYPSQGRGRIHRPGGVSNMHLVIETAAPPQPGVAVVAAYLQSNLMACKGCGQTMKRETQCQNCGAWCR